MLCLHRAWDASTVSNIHNIIKAARIAAGSKYIGLGDVKLVHGLGDVKTGYIGLVGDIMNPQVKTFSVAPIFVDGRFKEYSLLFTFRDNGEIHMQVMRDEDKCGGPADVTYNISDPDALASDIYLKLIMENSPEKPWLYTAESLAEMEAKIEKEETMKKAEETRKKESILFFTANLPVYAKIIAATRSALHKRGTLDDVTSPGIAFDLDDFYETGFDVTPVCPEGYSTDYTFTFRIGTANSAMIIKKCGEPYGKPLDIQDFLADLEALEANIGAHIDAEIGDKLMEKQKEPTFLDRFPDIASRIYSLADAARRVFVSFGAEDEVHIRPGIKTYDKLTGLSFYVNPVVSDDQYTEYAFLFTIDEDGTSMQILREGNDWGIPKVIDEAMKSPKVIAAFLKKEIWSQVLDSDSGLIHSR